MPEKTNIINVNISREETIPSPEDIKKIHPSTSKQLNFVRESRQVVENILDKKDKRLFFVVGPCSIHDTKAAMEYAARLKKLADQVKDKFFIIMRVYFEKPRTTVGWKGLINDPNLDDSFHIENGLKVARKLLLDIADLGLPASTEALDPITPQYLSELITWSAIGARTTESQTHREMASGLSMPVGIKNGTDGGIAIAINALKSVAKPHHFLGINNEGKICKFSTTGNRYAHIVLRGGGGKPNYDADSVKKVEEELAKNQLNPSIVVDCSHANTNKDYRLQAAVLADCMSQIEKGNKSFVGYMLESHLNEGRQDIPEKLSDLQYGVSVTDACIDWKTTEEAILKAYKNFKI